MNTPGSLQSLTQPSPVWGQKDSTNFKPETNENRTAYPALKSGCNRKSGGTDLIPRGGENPPERHGKRRFRIPLWLRRNPNHIHERMGQGQIPLSGSGDLPELLARISRAHRPEGLRIIRGLFFVRTFPYFWEKVRK